MFHFKFSLSARRAGNCLIVELIYSVLKLFAGFATAAFIAWKLIVIIVIIIAAIPAIINTNGFIAIL